MATSNGSNASSSQTGGEEEEDAEDSESSNIALMPLLSDITSIDDAHCLNADVSAENILDKFLTEWRSELQRRDRSIQSSRTFRLPAVEDQEARTAELEQAKELFAEASEAERCGDMHEAIRLYRRSMHLVPNIERLVHEQSRGHVRNSPSTEDMQTLRSRSASNQDGAIERLRADFLQRSFLDDGRQLFCKPSRTSSSVHISDLPPEIMFYILRWVVSDHLDYRTIEQCSLVCSGFFLMCRDEELWHLGCVKTWSRNTGTLTDAFPSWRSMLVMRPRVCLTGVYIARMSYIRHGESSFQDQFYRPWHFVRYYRYLRCFPDGRCIMLTTAEEPQVVLRARTTLTASNPQVLVGSYRLRTEDRVTARVKRQPSYWNAPSEAVASYMRRRAKMANNKEEKEQWFSLELRAEHARFREKKTYSGKLSWLSYSMTVKTRFRNYEVRNPTVQLLFSVTFAISCVLFELVIFEICDSMIWCGVFYASRCFCTLSHMNA